MGCCMSCCGMVCKVGCCGAGKTKTGSKLIYLLIMFLVVLLGILIRVYSADMFGGLFSFDGICPDEGGEGRDLCFGMMGVYRVSWALFTFFIVMAVCTFAWRVRGCRELGCWRVCVSDAYTDRYQGFHTGMWFCKIPLLLVFLFYPFFVPNGTVLRFPCFLTRRR